MATKLDFPTTGETEYEAPNGVKYVFDNRGYWKQEFEGEDFFNERYVQIPGDIMTGSLTAPSFNGNIGVDQLGALD